MQKRIGSPQNLPLRKFFDLITQRGLLFTSLKLTVYQRFEIICPFNSQNWSQSHFSLRDIANQPCTEENEKIIPTEYDVDATKQTQINIHKY